MKKMNLRQWHNHRYLHGIVGVVSQPVSNYPTPRNTSFSVSGLRSSLSLIVVCYFCLPFHMAEQSFAGDVTTSLSPPEHRVDPPTHFALFLWQIRLSVESIGPAGVEARTTNSFCFSTTNVVKWATPAERENESRRGAYISRELAARERDSVDSVKRSQTSLHGRQTVQTVHRRGGQFTAAGWEKRVTEKSKGRRVTKIADPFVKSVLKYISQALRSGQREGGWQNQIMTVYCTHAYTHSLTHTLSLSLSLSL